MTPDKSFATTAFASALIIALSASAAAQLKTVEIEVPGDPSQPPRAVPPALDTAPGDEIEFKRNGQGNVLLIFTNPGKTPFVDNQNRPVYSLRSVQAGRRFKIRSDHNPCAETSPGKSDCKYLVVDLKKPERPPLDPYIIIRQ